MKISKRRGQKKEIRIAVTEEAMAETETEAEVPLE